MANPEHIELIKQGVEVWNKWRLANPLLIPDLRAADLRNITLRAINLNDALLTGTDFRGADLEDSYFLNAQLTGALFAETNLKNANFLQATLTKAIFIKADLRNAELSETTLIETNFSGANLSGAFLFKADLTDANLTATILIETNLRKAILYKTDLTASTLVQTHLQDTKIEDCTVYGISAWDVDLEGATQTRLKITPDGVPEILVDDIEVAQFIYLVLNNKKIRNIIDSATSKTVLILGRFTSERKPYLDKLREELRKRGYVPILFDFEPSPNRNLTETVLTLAGLVKFVIADLSDPSSIPHELATVIPQFPSLPVQPIIASGQREYGMFWDWRQGFEHQRVLEPFYYESEQHLINNLSLHVIQPALNYRAKKDSEESLRQKVRELEEKVKRLEGGSSGAKEL